MWLRTSFLLLSMTVLASCSEDNGKGMTDISGAMPRLAFHMTRATDGAAVTADDYRGKVVVLYFGYTHCPDICPATLANLADALKQIGSTAAEIRVLFVTVDPNRDSLQVLRDYAAAFASEIDGLRGTEDELVALARRYRVTYGVTSASPGHPYSVMHSDAVFFFDRDGRARLVATSTDDTKAIALKLTQLSQWHTP
jgi:protein SCO1/2